MVFENEQTVRRMIFGGAMSLELPERFVDISAIRPINDTQVNRVGERVV
jgi:hypothetical protein